MECEQEPKILLSHSAKGRERGPCCLPQSCETEGDGYSFIHLKGLFVVVVWLVWVGGGRLRQGFLELTEVRLPLPSTPA